MSPMSDATRFLHSPAQLAATLATVFTGAIFGFFFAWVCSTMWGLDAADPRIAIPAMQAMNDSVQNAVFFPAFFLTPLVLLLAGGLAWRETARTSAVLLAAAAILYAVGGIVLTATINVPMNEALADVAVPADLAEATRIWEGYSQRWQFWNTVRMVVSGTSLLLAVRAVAHLR